MQSGETKQVLDLSHQISFVHLADNTAAFTFIPVDPLNTYVELMSKAMDADLDFLQTLPEDQEVSLGILSPEHLDILNSCAFRWRVPAHFRALVFLEAIVIRCTKCLVPMESVIEALDMLVKIRREIPADQWADSDVRYECGQGGLYTDSATPDDQHPSSLQRVSTRRRRSGLV